MAKFTLAIPEDLKKEMEKLPEINWSVIAREAIRKRLILLKEIKEFTKNSTLTEDDAIELGRKVNRAVAKRYLREK